MRVATVSSRLAAIFIVGVAFLALTACPPPITPDLVNIVQDTEAPVITIMTPGNNSSFRSQLTVGGIITDSSTAGDEAGVLESISFEVGGAEYLSRTLTFTDDGIVFDPPEREFTLFDETTGEFRIVVSTVEDETTGEPLLLTGFRQITVTATDKKGHETEAVVTVFAYTDGPYVEITSHADGDPYTGVEVIEGRVTNSVNSESTTEVDPDGLSYRIGADTVQVAPFDDRDVNGNGEFFDPDTGFFELRHEFNPLPAGGIDLVVTALDLAGYEGSASVSLIDKARSGIEFTAPVAFADGNYYYSSLVTTTPEANFYFYGTPFEPTEIDQIVYDTDGGLITSEVDLGYAGEAFEDFYVDLSGALDNAGNVRVNIRSYDTQGRLSSYRYTFIDDATLPDATGTLVGANVAVDLDFGSDTVWGNLNRIGAPTVADFQASAPLNGDPTITGVSVQSGDATNGYQVIRIGLNFTGVLPDANDPLTISPASNSLYDKANNEWSGSAVVALVDQRPPTIEDDGSGIVISSVTGRDLGDWYVNDTGSIDFQIKFSEAVTVTGSPTLELDLNNDTLGDGIYAVYSGGSGALHTFTYDVSPGHNTSGGYLTYAPGNLGMTGATVVDGLGQALIPSLPASTLGENVVIDTTNPVGSPLGLDVDATGGSVQRNNYVNAGNTNVQTTVTGVTSVVDANLNGGWIELLMDDTSFVPAVTGAISGATVAFDLLGSPSATEVQNKIAEGGHDFSVLVYDAAGNTTGVDYLSFLMTADYNAPGVPTGVTAAATGGHLVANYVNVHNTDIGISLTGMPTTGDSTVIGATAELLVNGGSFSPVVTSGTISGATGAFSVGAVPSSDPDISSGNNTFTVRLTDAAGNTGSVSTASDSLFADFDRPGVTSVTSVDSGSFGTPARGASDTVEVEFDEPVLDASVAEPGTGWYMRDNGAGLNDAFSAFETDVSVIASDGDANDQYGRFTLTPSNIQTTGTMEYFITQDSIRDIAGNGINQVTSWPDAVDAAGPWVKAALSLDNNSDGDVDRVEILFSESIDDSDVSEPSTGWYISSDGGTTSDEFNNYATQVYVIASDTGGDDEYGRFELSPANVDGTGQMQITFDANTFQDRATSPNWNVANSSWTAVTVQDGAEPRVRPESRSFDANTDGAVDAVELWFTEPIDDSTVRLDDGGAPASPLWDVRVDAISGYTRVTGNFDALNTAVSSFTDPSPVDDEYMTFTFTPSGMMGTGTTDIYFAADSFRDLAGNANELVGSGSAIDLDDRAAAVLLTASIDDEGTAGLFNSLNNSNDTLELSFSESIETPSGWTADSAEAMFEFANGTTDGNNFQDTGPEDITVAFTRSPNNQTLRMRLNSRTDSSAESDNLIFAGSTVAVVANTFTGGIEFNDANGFPVNTDASRTALFTNIIGSGSGQGAGGTVIAGSAGGSGGESRPPVFVPEAAVSQSGAAPNTRPYVAPRIAQLRSRRELQPAIRSEAAGQTSSTGIPDPATAVVQPVADPKVERLQAKPESPVNSSPASAETMSTAETGLSIPAPPAAEVVPTADVSVDSGADVALNPTTSPEQRPHGPTARPATGAGQRAEVRPAISGAAAVIGLVAILLIAAGGALVAMAKIGKRRRIDDGDYRAE